MSTSAPPPRALEEGRTHSYRMEDLSAAAEVARLEAQVQLVRGLEADFLDRAGLRPADHLLDLGCGPGFFAAWVARQRVPGGKVVGVDVDPSLLALARARAAPPGEGAPTEFLLGSAVRIPLPDACVDFAYSRFLFQHLDRPEAAVAEMVRVTRPGGTIAIVDTDDGGLVLHPTTPAVDAVLRASREAQAARGGDRLVGRKLKSFLVGAGLSDARVHVYPFTSEGVGAEAFLRVALGFKVDAIGATQGGPAPGWIDATLLRDAVAALPTLAATPGFYGHALGYAAWARVPGPR